MLKIKRIYDKPSASDGWRVLVDRIWPRGMTKQTASIDEWLKIIAPSHELRLWFRHDPAKWSDFKKRYHRELAAQEEVLKKLITQHKTITLLYSAKDTQHNNAVALQEYLSRLKHLK